MKSKKSAFDSIDEKIFTYVRAGKNYAGAGSLAGRWSILSPEQKKNAAELKRAFRWPLNICMQQAYIFNWSVEKENKLFNK